jgi:hypothetical protein
LSIQDKAPDVAAKLGNVLCVINLVRKHLGQTRMQARLTRGPPRDNGDFNLTANPARQMIQARWNGLVSLNNPSAEADLVGLDTVAITPGQQIVRTASGFTLITRHPWWVVVKTIGRKWVKCFPSFARPLEYIVSATARPYAARLDGLA